VLEAEKMKQLLRACELERREMDLIIAVATSEEERLQEAHLPNQGRSKLIETSNVSVCAIDVRARKPWSSVFSLWNGPTPKSVRVGSASTVRAKMTWEKQQPSEPPVKRESARSTTNSCSSSCAH
jgi:hypothetical protein